MNRSLFTSAITISGSRKNNRQSIRLKLRYVCSSEKQALCFWRSYYLIGGTPLELLFSGGGGEPLLGRCTSLQNLVAEFLCKPQIRKRREKPDKIEHAIFHMVCNGAKSSALRTVDGTFGEASPSIWKNRRTCIFDHRYSDGTMLKAELQVRLRHNALPHTDVGVTSGSKAMGPGLLT